MNKLLSLVGAFIFGVSTLTNANAADLVSDVVSTVESIVHIFDEPTKSVDPKELNCLAKNIYFESASESESGKIAVGMVTLNRTNDERWPNSVCGVVNQKTIIKVPKTVTFEETIRVGFFRTKETVVRTYETVISKTICQFSWVCEPKKKIKENDERWQESLRVARYLLEGGSEHYENKMGDWYYFHATHVSPGWRNLKRTERIGQHIFYKDRTK